MEAIINFQHQLPAFAAPIAYLIDFLNQHPLKPADVRWTLNGNEEQEAIQLNYGEECLGEGYHIPAQRLIFQQQLPALDQLQPGAYTFESFTLYSVEQERGAESPFLQSERFGFDWVEMLFFHLSRLEEYYAKKEDWDEWEMMRTELQFLPKHQLHQHPVVDRLVFVIYKALGLRPQSLTTRFSLSHDVDVIRKFTTPYRYARSAGRLLWQGRGWAAQRALWRSYWKSRSGEERDPYDTFDWLLNGGGEEQKMMYVLAGGITQYDRFCQIEHPAMKEVLGVAKERGYQIGLHPSYAAHQDAALFEKERQRLVELVGEPLRYSRQHFLHFDFHRTPHLLEQQGMAVDSSLGYQDQIGFRCGTGFAYALYNFAEQRAFRFKEQPLVVMDTALLMHTQEDLPLFEHLLRQFLDQNGKLTQITFNFHNSTFDPLRLDAAHLIRLYRSLF